MLPDGKVLPHPALVISCDDLQIMEPGLFSFKGKYGGCGVFGKKWLCLRICVFLELKLKNSKRIW